MYVWIVYVCMCLCVEHVRIYLLYVLCMQYGCHQLCMYSFMHYYFMYEISYVFNYGSVYYVCMYVCMHAVFFQLFRMQIGGQVCVFIDVRAMYVCVCMQLLCSMQLRVYGVQVSYAIWYVLIAWFIMQCLVCNVYLFSCVCGFSIYVLLCMHVFVCVCCHVFIYVIDIYNFKLFSYD